LDEVDLDVLAHLLDLIVRRAEEQSLIEMQVVDDGQQARPAQHLLCDRLQAFLQIHLDVRHDELLRYFLLFH